MKPNTLLFARFESKGRPQYTQDVSGPMQDVAFAMVKWMRESPMGTSFNITTARSPAELNIAVSRRNNEPRTQDAEDTAAFMQEQMLALMNQGNLSMEAEED